MEWAKYLRDFLLFLALGAMILALYCIAARVIYDLPYPRSFVPMLIAAAAGFTAAAVEEIAGAIMRHKKGKRLGTVSAATICMILEKKDENRKKLG